MTRMRYLSRLFGIAALVAASASCGDVVRQGRSPMFLTIDSLTGKNGNLILSDVDTIVTTGGTCSIANPCHSIFDDLASVVLRGALKDTTNPSSPNAPTTNKHIII